MADGTEPYGLEQIRGVLLEKRDKNEVLEGGSGVARRSCKG